jgi:hypothetical protein
MKTGIMKKDARHVFQFMSKTLLIMFFSIYLNADGAESDSSQEGWPRLFESKGNQVVVYQPQLTEWENYKTIRAKAAVAVTLKGQKTEYYGAITMEATTVVDFIERIVEMKSLRLTNLIFPNTKPSLALQCKTTVIGALPKNKTLLISLDRVLAGLERSKLETKITEVNFEPPPIYYSEGAALLLLFMGEPKFEPIPKVSGLFYAVNTNWDLILELWTSKYYLLNGDNWFVTNDVLKGPWQPAQTLPGALRNLPADENWANVKKHIPGKRAQQVPKIIVSKEPAELIVTKGTPTFGLVPNTKLLFVTNTDSDLFLYSADRHYYFLTAGRWFKAKKLQGPWQASSSKLPADFRNIPSDHEKASVLNSVPGTPEADAAVILASVPRKATVDRKSTKVTVIYDGSPTFIEIKETSPSVFYAVNSPYSVFRVNKKYYCCHNGVWFEALTSAGPWIVCVKVPAVIYSIPASHPKYNVTYVYVYDTTPDTVVVGYTSGYSGSYVATTGVIMFGLGLWAGHELADDHDHYHHYHYHSHYYSYGCAARYDYHYGGYYRSAQYYGPHGGAGGWAGYDPGSGTYYRGGYANGPYGSAFAREAYNPYTDRYGAQARVSTPYQSWGRTVVADGDDWARAGHRSQGGRTVAGLETSAGGKAVGGYNKWTDQGAVVGKDKHGDVYVGRDGDVYKRSGDSWQRNSGSGWESIDTTQARSQAQTRANDAQSRVSSRSGSASRSDINRSQIDRSQQNRSTDTTRSRSQAQSRANDAQSRVSSRSSTPSRSSTTQSSINRSQQSRSSVQRDLNRNFQSRQQGNRFARSSSSRSRSVGSRSGGGRARRR